MTNCCVNINRSKTILLVIVFTILISINQSYMNINNIINSNNINDLTNINKQRHQITSIKSFDDRGRKPYSRGGSSGGGGGGSYRGGGGGGGRGGSFSSRRPQADSMSELKFSKTIKINPEEVKLIEEMTFSDKTAQVLRDKGFKEMTPVQTQSYDYVYSGVDLVARSKTGTGKTLAFGIPLIERLIQNNANLKSRGGAGLPLVIILEPTRELAIQVATELSSVASVHGLRVSAIYGGVPMSSQERDLRYGIHIVVATPGRALDHISRGSLELGSVLHVVLDEGDTMLEMGFQNDVESIIANVKSPGKESQLAAAKSLSKFGSNWDNNEDDFDEDADESLQALGVKTQRDVQMLLFSATMPGWICKLTNKHMNKPIFLDAVLEGETRLASTIKHLCIRLPRGDRIKTLSSAMEDLILTKGAGGQTIVFTNTKDEADNLVSADCFGQLRSKVLHGDISQSARQTTIKQFKDGQIDVLVATDVAARGLDIAGVDLVVHTGPPNDHDTFVHRSGRTGRAGRNGTSIMLYTYTDEEKRLSTFEKILNFNFEKSHQPGPEEVARASAWYAAKKLEKVNDEAINYFLPHAKSMITSLLNDEKEFEIPHFSLVKNKDELEIDMDVSDYTSDQVEKLMARCLAVLSNKNSIASKSLLTSEVGKTTLLINAVFKNGTTPNNVRDWQRVFSGILRRSFNIDDIKFGKFVMGQVSKSNDYCGVVDIDADLANTLIDQIKDDPSLLPSGIEITRCIKLPHIIEDSFESRINLSGDRFGSRGGSGGYNRGGSAGESKFRQRSFGDRDRTSRSRDEAPAGGGRVYRPR